MPALRMLIGLALCAAAPAWAGAFCGVDVGLREDGKGEDQAWTPLPASAITSVSAAGATLRLAAADSSSLVTVQLTEIRDDDIGAGSRPARLTGPVEFRVETPLRLTLRCGEAGPALATAATTLPDFSAEAARAFLTPNPAARQGIGPEVHPIDDEVFSGELVTEAFYDVAVARPENSAKSSD